MSAELQADFTPGLTCYFQVRSAIGSIWNGSAFVAYATANISQYKIAATEQGTASGFYTAGMAAVAAGFYSITFKQQAGGSAAESDPTVGVGQVMWDGSAAVVLSGDAFARIGAAGAGLTALGDARIANLDAAVSSRSTYAGADTAGTTILLTRIGGAITISGGKVAATMGAADYAGNTVQTGDAYARVGAAGVGLTNLGDARLANMDAAVSSRGTSTVTAAQVYAQVVQAVATDTYAEPAGVPAATATLEKKLAFLYESLRNKITVTASSKVFCNDAGSSQWSKALSDDGTTFTEAKGA